MARSYRLALSMLHETNKQRHILFQNTPHFKGNWCFEVAELLRLRKA